MCIGRNEAFINYSDVKKATENRNVCMFTAECKPSRIGGLRQ